MLRVILNEKNQSLYQLEKTSNLSHATLNDIYNERCNIDKCSIYVLNKIAEALNLTIDSLYKYLSYNDLSFIKYDENFDLFKSNTLQQLKRMDEITFVKNTIDSNIIEAFYEQKDYLKSLYLLSLVDYLSIKNNITLEVKHQDLRQMRLKNLYVPKSIYLLLLTKSIKISEVYKESIKTFLDHNIVEAEIENVI